MSRHGTSSLAYLAQKFLTAVTEAKLQMNRNSSASSAVTYFGISEAIAKGLHAFQKQLTAIGVITGAAMAPTLNAAAVGDPEARERFLLRRIPKPAANRNLFEGDVVAFHSPLSTYVGEGEINSEKQHVLVRRVASMEGDELVAGEDEDDPEETFRIPEGYCWVLADNSEMTPTEAMDSRAFGPLPLKNILGRIMYAATSETNHGPVENSVEGMAIDASVLEAELDLDALCNTDDTENEREKDI